MGRPTRHKRAARGGSAGARRPGKPAERPRDRGLRALAQALGESNVSASRLDQLSKVDGLRAAIVAKAFELDPLATPSKLRKALAERATRRQIGRPPSARATAAEERAMAASLIVHSGPVRSDSELLARLAAQLVGAPSIDAATLRLYVLRTGVSVGQAPVPTVTPAPAPATAEPTAPVLADFAQEVRVLAGLNASGWAGNRRAYISHVWQSVAQTHPAWGLDEPSFKSLLAEAHRTGHIQLANADLRDKARLKDVQASATAYKNMVWHFIRVEDE